MDYVVKAGDSLSKIAQANGYSNWKDLWKANPNIKDPNVIKPGQKIIIPGQDAPKSQPGNLEKTLPPLDSTVLQTKGPNTLPQDESGLPKLDQLSALRLALKRTAEIASGQGSVEGMKAAETTLSQRGITPSNISGGSFANIIDFINQKTTKPIVEQTNTVLDSVSQAATAKNQARDDARSNLNMLNNIIQNSGKSWDQVPDQLKKQVRQLEQTAEIPEGFIEQFSRSKPKANLLSSVNGTDSSGNEIISFVYADENGNPGVVRTVKTGGKAKVPGATQSEVTASQKKAMIAKARTAINAPGTRGADKKISPDLYTKLRQDYAEITGETNSFDAVFSTELSPQERANLGIGKAAGVDAGSTEDDPFLKSLMKE